MEGFESVEMIREIGEVSVHGLIEVEVKGQGSG